KYSKILSLNETTPTLVATDLSHLAVPVDGGLRKLTPKEGLRLFGYPENYSLSSVTTPKAYDLLGNTVAVTVIKAVSQKLLDSYTK
ncbi:DNA cytosine methyltransferase, partial [Lactobacillus helveticus]